ncbi:MAG: tRNA preQ1(34) S-adenosylmethionine ribosyltransferase-isomerase QueA [Clostridia bacterium]|nr:tRNA preQ1(34) S-adenosylmethionine ribosyltransferase-isomerase QueA [Clostridia bacterium]
MKTSDFYYDLPKELIAQTPADPRDSSKLLVMHKEDGTLEHKHFYDIIDYLNKGDCLVLNDSRVLPARLFGVRKDTGAVIELLLLKQIEANVWETLVKPGKKAKEGCQISFGDGKLNGVIKEVLSDGNRIIEFDRIDDFYPILDELGEMPLPPYITEKLEDRERYQTVYSRELGSAAAPTAGLHFTDELLKKIKDKGIKTAFVTLHVGLGTFRPVKADEITEHTMHSEFYQISSEAADTINKAKKNGKRVICVGTTSCRTIESAARDHGEIKECSGWTDIFIYPGYKFNVMDALITNFHLPESTLIMLVSAFCGYENTMNTYNTAVSMNYRFFSFGDAMFIC